MKYDTPEHRATIDMWIAMDLILWIKDTKGTLQWQGPYKASEIEPSDAIRGRADAGIHVFGCDYRIDDPELNPQ